MKSYKHGMPGIGITGKTGLKGKSGNSVYFGTIDSFFVYINDNDITDSSIDYDDIDYDITYTDNEKRLNYIYNTGDVLYVLSDDPTNSKVLYMVEITDDMTTCTKEYFLQHITYKEPFTIGKNQYHDKVNIVNTGNDNLFKANELYKQSSISATYVSTSTNSPDISTLSSIENINLNNTYENIPLRYTDIRKKLVNNGKEFLLYEYGSNKNSSVILSLLKYNESEYLNIEARENEAIHINVNTSVNSLYIDNLYVRTHNHGNIETKNSLYYSTLNLANNGNCYTLSMDDYDSSTQLFNINLDSFFTTTDISLNEYKIGYIHMYWNYNDNNYNPSTNTNLYKPNYITGTLTDTTPNKVLSIKKDADGNFLRDWNNTEYKNVDNMYIKQLLINTLNSSTLKEVSLSLSDMVDISTYEKYLDVHGIIKTEYINEYLVYDFIKTENNCIYKHYQNSNKSDELYINNSLIDISLLNSYIDTSFYSGIEYVTDPSVLTIKLNKHDNTDLLYRHHNILQWISAPNGLKYYSNLTTATFNYQTNSFDITTNENEFDTDYNISYVNNYGSYANDIFEIVDNTIILNRDISIIEILRNNESIDTSIINNKILLNITENSLDISDSSNLLYNLYYEEDLNINTEYDLYTIKYKLKNENKEYIYTFKKPINGYTEYRTLPDITINAYTAMLSLEKLNNRSNNILCNLFQTFFDITIDNFTENDWGKYDKNAILKIKLTTDSISINTDELIMIKPIVDLYNANISEFSKQDNILNTNNGYYEFSISDACSGTYHLRLFKEFDNPEPTEINGYIYISELSILSNGTEYSLPLENGCIKDLKNVLLKNSIVYKSNNLNIVIEPLEYAVKLTKKDITNIDTYKWYGLSNVPTVSLSPCNDYVFKARYFQDNTLNLNITSNGSYLKIQFDIDKFNSILIDDEYSFLYNNEILYRDDYKKDIYIKQESYYFVRSPKVIKSMSKWNKLYENEYHYNSDNPYMGYNSTFGNGYQYLPKTSDTEQYITLGILSLSDTKNVNEIDIFEHNEDLSIEYNELKLYNALIKNIEWNFNDNPYLKCYDISPRIMFNDEKQLTVILMLRKPIIQ